MLSQLRVVENGKGNSYSGEHRDHSNACLHSLFLHGESARVEGHVAVIELDAREHERVKLSPRWALRLAAVLNQRIHIN